jgi:peroxiredoxin
MAIQVGEKIPDIELQVATPGGTETVRAAELFKGRTVLFAVPGAFTPTCSEKHLPGFVEKAEEIKAKGVDRILCLAVNDAFVMDAWRRDRKAGDKVVMVADGNAEFTKALGLEMDAGGFGMGIRSQRYAAIVEDGVLNKLFVEKPMAFDVSRAEAVLEAL